jgi:hypothetical protein
VRLAEEKMHELRDNGVRVERFDIDEQLILWCNERGLEIDSKARSQYAAEKVRELDRSKSLFSRRT